MDDNGQKHLPPEWMSSIDRSESDLVAGRVFDGTAVRQRLRDAIKQMQSEAVERSSQDH